MKKLIKYGFLVGFLFSTLFYNLRFSYLVLFYSVDNKSFTEAFCENTDKPELQCNGKCYLKDVKKEADKPAPDGIMAYKTEINLFIPEILQLELPDLLKLHKPSYLYYNNYKAPGFKPLSPPPKTLVYIG